MNDNCLIVDDEKPLATSTAEVICLRRAGELA